MHGIRGLIRAGLIMAGCLVVVIGPSASAATNLSFSATLNGRDATSVSGNAPLRLNPDTGVRVDVHVTNGTNAPVTVEAVRIEGRVIGLSFFSYTTQVDLALPPASSGTREFQVDLGDLGDQATGLIPTRLTLLDQSRHELAAVAFPVDVRGHTTSVYGVFGLAVAGITLIWIVSLSLRLVSRRLPANRWARAVQFSAPGFGIGLTLTFSVSATRLLTPDAATWVPFVAIGGAVGLVVGYFTPGPRVEEEDDADLLVDHRYAALAAGAASPAIAGASADPALPARIPEPAPAVEAKPAPAAVEGGRHHTVAGGGTPPRDTVAGPAPAPPGTTPEHRTIRLPDAGRPPVTLPTGSRATVAGPRTPGAGPTPPAPPTGDEAPDPRP